jgi:hypothetical protein
MSDRPFTSDRAKRNAADGTVTLQLRSAINVEGRTVSELTFKKPRVKHLLKLDDIAGSRARTVSLIQSMAHIPAPSIDEMDGADYLDCSEIIADFLEVPSLFPPKPPTSPSSSTGLSEISGD